MYIYTNTEENKFMEGKRMRLTGRLKLEYNLITKCARAHFRRGGNTMSVTIKQIAELGSVSRGTVDRVLNGRGKVKPETEKKIRNICEQLGYTPNLAAKGLAAKKKSYVIGVLFTAKGNVFFDEILDGILSMEQEMAEYGIRFLIKKTKGYDAARQAKSMEEMRNKVNLLILNPINDELIRKKEEELSDSGIGIIHLNTDITDSSRLCYIGSDYRKGGEMAGGIFSFLLGSRDCIGVITGSAKILGHVQRIEGFEQVISQKCPSVRILKAEEGNDDEETAYRAAKRMFKMHPNLNAVFIAAAGTEGICRAIRERNNPKDLKVISFDSSRTTEELIRQGIIQATICQQPGEQGRLAVKAAFDYLVNGRLPEQSEYLVGHEIKILENLES